MNLDAPAEKIEHEDDSMGAGLKAGAEAQENATRLASLTLLLGGAVKGSKRYKKIESEIEKIAGLTFSSDEEL